MPAVIGGPLDGGDCPEPNGYPVLCLFIEQSAHVYFWYVRAGHWQYSPDASIAATKDARGKQPPMDMWDRLLLDIQKEDNRGT